MVLLLYSRKETEPAWMFINKWMNNESVLLIQNASLFDYKEKWKFLKIVWMESRVLSEVTQTKNDKIYMFSFTQGS